MPTLNENIAVDTMPAELPADPRGWRLRYTDDGSQWVAERVAEPVVTLGPFDSKRGAVEAALAHESA